MKTFDLPLSKPVVKPTKLVVSERMQEAIDRIAQRSLEEGAKTALKGDKTQRAAQTAIAEAMLPWLSFMQEHDPETVKTFFIQIASMTNEAARNKIMKHDLFPTEAKPIIEAHVEKMKAFNEQQRLKAAAARAAREAEKLKTQAPATDHASDVKA